MKRLLSRPWVALLILLGAVVATLVAVFTGYLLVTRSSRVEPVLELPASAAEPPTLG